MMWFFVMDAFCIGMCLGAYIVYRDVKLIAASEVKKIFNALKERT